MTTPTKPAASRYRVHTCLLVTALVSHGISAQPPASAPRQPPVEAPSAEVVNQYWQQTLEKQRRDGRSASARAAIGSVAVAARCVEGYVINGSHRVSAQDVEIVAAERRDCDGDRCRAYQVTAARDSTQPFDLEVLVTCS
jgi:hypothetical protein